MPTTHTPGPWRVRLTTDGFAVLGAVPHKPNAYVALTRTEEDARLTASAPDLLAALQHLIDSTTESIEPDGYRALCPPARSALSQAFAAIAKATGTPE